MSIQPINPDSHFPLRAPVDQVGYIPVYITLEALQIEWGTDCQYMIIRQESFP